MREVAIRIEFIYGSVQYLLFSSRLTLLSWSWLLSDIGLLMHGDRSLFRNLGIIGIFVTRSAA